MHGLPRIDLYHSTTAGSGSGVTWEGGAIGLRVFFCTDATVVVPLILETYAGRWAMEVCFRDLKQLLDFGDSSARKRAAVERTAPFVGFVYTALVLWFAEGVHRTSIATPPLRPWYRHKRGLCFADVLRAAQRALTPLDLPFLARSCSEPAGGHRQGFRAAGAVGPSRR